MIDLDVIVVGAGAAGLMCAATAGYRGRRVRVLDHANKAGKKILMSGGGRCNFTHLNSTPENFLSANPHFCISALKRYTPHHFLELVERHGVSWCEKTPGQLFCVDSSREILDLLLRECEWAAAEISLKISIDRIEPVQNGYQLHTSAGLMRCESLVIAAGGLSIPTLGASGFGYEVARQFGLDVLPTRAGLVPFTLQPAQKEGLAPLSGLSADVAVQCRGGYFREPMLITHRGLSGPAMLQISSYWQPGDEIKIDLLPGSSCEAEIRQLRDRQPNGRPEVWLAGRLPKRFAQLLCEQHGWQESWQYFDNERLESLAQQLHHWRIKPSGTEGYRTAEVTLGGVNTSAVSSKTLMANDHPGLYFIGEVLDVTGHLGGHNFQWAWASAWCAGQYV
ncbi:MAG: aminoacetone oxidase family FAD-binding enzyme [Gammaproteobacteria bacterium HGW-Gammaproteobacteria-14]|nr:MAG: aminoacetone oxidase family FAD-binding enzyme [Gammaproteobacteria bacterium HGW-Gammaproteobacteria-14]